MLVADVDGRVNLASNDIFALAQNVLPQNRPVLLGNYNFDAGSGHSMNVALLDWLLNSTNLLYIGIDHRNRGDSFTV